MSSFKNKNEEWQNKAFTFLRAKQEHSVAGNLHLVSTVGLFFGLPPVEALKGDLEKLATGSDAGTKEEAQNLLLELALIQFFDKHHYQQTVNIPEITDMLRKQEQIADISSLLLALEASQTQKTPLKESITKTDYKNSLDETYRRVLVMGVSAGILLLIGGIILCLLGLTGSIEVILEGGAVKARLLNASPGVVIAFLGLLIVWRYKPKITQATRTIQTKTERERVGERYVSSRYETHENKTSGARLAGPR